MTAKKNLLQVMYEAYPDNDLLGIDPPDADTTLSQMRARCEQVGGDGLFAFLVREIGGAGDRETAQARIQQVCWDLLQVATAVDFWVEKEGNGHVE